MNGLQGQDVLRDGLSFLLGGLNLPLNAANFVVELVQASVHVLALSLGIAVRIDDIINVPLQVGLAGLQLFEPLFVAVDFRVELRAAGLLAYLCLDVGGKLGIVYQTPGVLNNLRLNPLSGNGILLRACLKTFDKM